MAKKTKSTITRTTALLANSKAIKGLKITLTTFLAFITLFGLIGFSLFILEESSQTLVFSVWQSIPAKRWDITLEGVDLMKDINTTGKVINATLGWINPLSYMSYNAFHKSTDHYIKALSSRVFANAPEAFVGRTVQFKFTPKTIQQKQDHIELINGRIHIIVDKLPETKTILVQGRLEQKGNTFVVDIR